MDTGPELPTAPPETALAALEAAFAITLTLRDLSGSLRGGAAGNLVSANRNSHRRQPVCDAGFAPACVAHCRRALNASCRARTAPFVHTCWKGVREVVVPVRRDGELLGIAFAGAWRGEASPPGPWRTAWNRLPAWDVDHAARIAGAVRLAVDGLFAGAGRVAATGSRRDLILAWVRTNLATAGRAGLARHLGLAASRTSHAVREACGCSLQELIANARLARACHLLRTSALPIAAVGAQVGWGDAPHFSRSFRRLTGMPPRRWRRDRDG